MALGDREEGGHRFPKASQEQAPASCLPHFLNLSGNSQTYTLPEMSETGALQHCYALAFAGFGNTNFIQPFLLSVLEGGVSGLLTLFHS